MGLSKSKERLRKGEEPKKGPPHIIPKPKEKPLEKHSSEAKPADREAEKPPDSLHPGTVKGQRSSASSEALLAQVQTCARTRPWLGVFLLVTTRLVATASSRGRTISDALPRQAFDIGLPRPGCHR
ncbi:spermatogenesis-associated protein 33 isoform X2 [Tupaia chinensis]|uniref:spermatogenesis-associated protein 33 isoform X2 n=1 Tax=Tupaia chinensis TaxID=246437 RepID=UPI0003C92364|nr:spermatogenesis-associated protein 33 isoform X2 [Tupaia chinensis]